MPPRRKATTDAPTATAQPDESQVPDVPLKDDEVAHVNTPPLASAGREPQPGDPSSATTMAMEALNRIVALDGHVEAVIKGSNILADRLDNVEEWINPSDGPNMVDSLNGLRRRLDVAERDHQARVNQLEESLDIHIGASMDRMTLIQKQLAEGGTVPAIYAAVWAMMGDVQGVGKHGQMDPASRMGNYKFTRYDDLKRELGAACRAHGVMLQSETINVVNERDFEDKRKTRVQIAMRYLFTSLVDGSTVKFEVVGESIDTSDKASGKAMTMALKTALTQAFMLAAEDTEDPDATRPGEDDIPREARQDRRDQSVQRRDSQPDYQVGDTVTVAGTTFTKHSDGPAIPSPAYDPAKARADAAQQYAPNNAPRDAANPWDQGPPKDERTPQEKAQAAAQALGKSGLTMPEWSAISDHARKLDLLDTPVTTPDGAEMSLKYYMVAVGRTLTP